MAIERNINSDDLPAGEALIQFDEEQQAPDISIEIDEEGGATVDIGTDEDSDVPFDSNLAEVIDPSVLQGISSDLLSMFQADQSSRKDWEEQYGKGLKLLGFNMEERTKPFKGACGVAHPLLTESIVQFQSQALKELLPAEGPVRTQVLGKETREKLMQADRVRDFMNYQITSVMEEYTPEFDQLLFYVGYGGSAFKKVYYDENRGRMVSALVLPDNLYIPYNGSSVMSECQRATHRVFMSPNDYRKAVVRGQYLDTAMATPMNEVSQSTIKKEVDRTTGIQANTNDEELSLLEFSVDWDIEGFEHMDDDGEPTGIALPYIITVDETTGDVIGVRRNWKEGDRLFKRKQYYVHYLLVQGPGAYGLGFLHLVGGLSKTATSALQQLIDSGTLANLPAGFKAKGARIMNDDVPLSPGEWRDMDVGGADLQASILPLPYKEPSQTLFALLGASVDAGRRLASITDMQVGDSNQNAAVGTTIALLEKGSAVMSSIHKRLHYSQKLEFQLLAKGFSEYLPPEYPYDVPGESRKIKAKDFDDRIDVLPVSDPNIFSVAQRITMAQTQLQLAQSAPQMHNMYESYRRMYEAIGVRDIDQILNSQNIDKPKDPVSENSQALDGSPLKAFAGQQHDAHIMAHLMFGLSPMMQGMPNVAVNIQKHIFEHIKLKAEEDVEAELFKQYGTDPENLVSALQREAMVAVKTAQYFQEVKKQQEQLAGPQTDPLVELKKQELQQGATRDQAKDQNDKASLQLKQQSEQADQQEGQARLALQKQAQDQKAMMDAIKLQQENQKHSSQLSHDGYKHDTQLRQQGIQHAADLYQSLKTQEQAQQTPSNSNKE
jgi:hypothetical protein